MTQVRQTLAMKCLNSATYAQQLLGHVLSNGLKQITTVHDIWARGHLGARTFGRSAIWAQGHLGVKYVRMTS